MGIKSQGNCLSPRAAIPHFMLLLQTINVFTIVVHVFCIYEVTVSEGIVGEIHVSTKEYLNSKIVDK